MKNASKTIEANVALNGNDRGVILCQGGKFGGWAVYMNNGKIGYYYNWFGLKQFDIQSNAALPPGEHTVTVDFRYDGGGTGKGGSVTISADGQELASGRVDATQPAVFSADETADVGMDVSTQVVPVFKNTDDSEFSGVVQSVTVSVER